MLDLTLCRYFCTSLNCSCTQLLHNVYRQFCKHSLEYSYQNRCSKSFCLNFEIPKRVICTVDNVMFFLYLFHVLKEYFQNSEYLKFTWAENGTWNKKKQKRRIQIATNKFYLKISVKLLHDQNLIHSELGIATKRDLQ